ncbi:hypothetical protein ES702_02148 [subsurface metagenome]
MEGSVKYATFFLIFSIAFSYFAFALMFSTVSEGRWDISLDVEQIMSAGILLGEADDLNLTYGSGWQYFTVNNTEIRVEWDWIVTIGDHFRFQTHVKFFGLDLAWTEMGIRDYGTEIYNSSVIVEWNNNTKWSRFKFKNGYELFFTDPEQEHNMTRAIYDDGTVTVTVAESLTITEDVNFMTFVSWYAGMITGTNNYGLPSIFNVVLQSIGALSLLSVIILAKEMISL